MERAPSGITSIALPERHNRPNANAAASAGFYTSPWDQKQYPRLQLCMIEELMDGKRPDLPRVRDSKTHTFKPAPKAKPKGDKQKRLLD